MAWYHYNIIFTYFNRIHSQNFANVFVRFFLFTTLKFIYFSHFFYVFTMYVFNVFYPMFVYIVLHILKNEKFVFTPHTPLLLISICPPQAYIKCKNQITTSSSLSTLLSQQQQQQYQHQNEHLSKHSAVFGVALGWGGLMPDFNGFWSFFV